MKQTIFKIYCTFLVITLVIILTFVILMACNVSKWEIQPYIWLGLSLCCEGVEIYLTKKSKKDGTND